MHKINMKNHTLARSCAHQNRRALVATIKQREQVQFKRSIMCVFVCDIVRNGVNKRTQNPNEIDLL